MRMSGGAIELSVSDLSGFLSCIHLTALDLAVAKGEREPPTWIDPVLIVLRERGLDHERGYVDGLRALGLTIIDLSDSMAAEAVTRSVEAIQAGAAARKPCGARTKPRWVFFYRATLREMLRYQRRE